MTMNTFARERKATGHPLLRNLARSAFQIAASSRLASRIALEVGGTVLRGLGNDWLSMRAFNVASHVAWPDLELRPRRTAVSKGLTVTLRPHAGEFDFQCLFSKRLAYEPEVFRLISSVLDSYDTLVEIGANVGAFTILLAILAKRGQSVISLEPSPEAFRRLQDNLHLNRRIIGEARIVTLNAAMGDKAGTLPFYEPVGHLTNGSLDRQFAAHFSESVNETRVVCIGAAELEELIGPGGRRALIKLDCEGAEPMILAGLESLLERLRPDLIVEVTEVTAASLNAMHILSGRYEKYLIGEEGLARFERFEPTPRFRDWFLKAKPDAA
jgi:FkbM family methyltransferase